MPLHAYMKTDAILLNVSYSKAEGKITVNSGVDAHLDELRQQYADLPEHLNGVAAELREEPAFRSTSM